jgi:hypothetical protein
MLRLILVLMLLVFLLGCRTKVVRLDHSHHDKSMNDTACAFPIKYEKLWNIVDSGILKLRPIYNSTSEGFDFEYQFSSPIEAMHRDSITIRGYVSDKYKIDGEYDFWVASVPFYEDLCTGYRYECNPINFSTEYKNYERNKLYTLTGVFISSKKYGFQLVNVTCLSCE